MQPPSSKCQNGGSAREHWQRKTWETLKINYGKAPSFAAYAPAIEALYARRFDRLLDLQLEVLTHVRGWFGITQPLVHSSSLALVGSKTDRIIDMCKKLGARTYLSGRGGSTGYLDVEALARAGIAVAWQDFHHPSYPQRYPGQGFVSHLAFLDLVLNCGPDSRAVLWPAAHARVAG